MHPIGKPFICLKKFFSKLNTFVLNIMFNNLLKPTIFISKQFKNLFIKRVILYVASLGIMLVYRLTISSEYK